MIPAIDLRAKRINRGLSQTQAAKDIGIPLNTYARAETGEAIPRAATAFKIASFYGYKVTDLWPLEPLPESREAV